MSATLARWTDELDADAVAVLHAAVRDACRRGADPMTVTQADFPLGSARGPRSAALKRDLTCGRGFVLVRGFPVAELCPFDVELAYMGLGTHWARR